MHGDHLADLFGDLKEFEDWMEKNQLIHGGFSSWSKLEILPDDHPEHEKSLEEYMEDQEMAVQLIIANDSKTYITITLNSGTIAEKTENFPDNLLDELKKMAMNGPFKVQLKEI